MTPTPRCAYAGEAAVAHHIRITMPYLRFECITRARCPGESRRRIFAYIIISPPNITASARAEHRSSTSECARTYPSRIPWEGLRDSWYEATAWPPRYCGGARCSTTIHALTVGRRGASREASRHGDHRPGSAQARESIVDQSGRRHDH